PTTAMARSWLEPPPGVGPAGFRIRRPDGDIVTIRFRHRRTPGPALHKDNVRKGCRPARSTPLFARRRLDGDGSDDPWPVRVAYGRGCVGDLAPKLHSSVLARTTIDDPPRCCHPLDVCCRGLRLN